jgi:molecular chaperone IbpA
MNAYDLAPLFRSGVGFDRLARLAESASRMAETSNSYPPYNIERLGSGEDNGDAYAITVAVAGFAQDDLAVDVEGSTLTITGHKDSADKQEQSRLLHRGIALRDFVRRFQLADNVAVTGADLKDGLLTVALKRVVPEALKPRRIAIGTAQAQLANAA